MKRGLLAASIAWLLLWAACAAQAHELRPGVLELREGQPGTYSLLWKRPAGGEVEIRIAPVLPAECRAATPGATLLTPGALVVRGTITLRRRHPRPHHRHRRARVHRHRRAGARLPRRRLARDPPAQADEPGGDAGRAHDRAAAFRRLPAPGHRAHPARRRPPAVRAGAAADRARPLDAGEDDHRVHAGAQHHAGGGHARLRERAAAAAECGDRAVDPVPGPGDRARAARADELHDPPPVGGGLRLRAAARLRLRQRVDDDGAAAGGDTAGAAGVQCRRRSRTARLRRPDPSAGAGLPRARRSIGPGSWRRCRAMWSARSGPTGRSSAWRCCWGRCDERLGFEAGPPACRHCWCWRCSPCRPGRTSSPARPRASSPACCTRCPASTMCWRWWRSACGARNSARRRSGCCR